MHENEERKEKEREREEGKGGKGKEQCIALGARVEAKVPLITDLAYAA